MFDVRIGRQCLGKLTCRQKIVCSNGTKAAAALKQPQRAEAGVAVAADDDVIVDGDAKRARSLNDLFGHGDIRARGRWIARGVIMYQQQRAGRMIERAFQ